jgi:hypothetical protein
VTLAGETQDARFRTTRPEKLLDHSRLPLAWHDQRIVLGFG